MKVYLAARFSRRDELQGYAADLEAIGVTVVARWLTRNEDSGLQHTLRAGEADPYWAEAASEDFEDIEEADALIAFADAGPGITRGGRHTEFGFAYAKHKDLFLVGEREHIFHHLPEVTRFAGWSDALSHFLAPMSTERFNRSFRALAIARFLNATV